jgi:hypothetical protein
MAVEAGCRFTPEPAACNASFLNKRIGTTRKDGICDRRRNEHGLSAEYHANSEHRPRTRHVYQPPPHQRSTARHASSRKCQQRIQTATTFRPGMPSTLFRAHPTPPGFRLPPNNAGRPVRT